MAPELKLRLFGPPQISLGARALSFTRRPAIALLAYLAITGRMAARETLAALLAGDTTESLARQHLRNALSDLNSKLGDYLVVSRQTIALDRAQPYWLDVEEFRAILSDRSAEADPDRLEYAVSLCTDELLAGLVLRQAPLFDTWLESQRKQLRGMLAHALQQLLNHHVRVGATAAGLAVAERLLSIEPLREATQRQRMLLLVRDGRRAAALEHYEAFRQHLAQHLGVAPLPATTALYDRLRAIECDSDGILSQDHPGAPPQAPAVPPTAGLEHELALLLEHLADPNCRLITIVGLADAAATRLASRVAAHYSAQHTIRGSSPFPDGVYAIDLLGADQLGASDKDAAPMMGPHLASALGRALGLDICASPDVALLAFLHARALLLVLSHIEPSPADVDLLGALLRQAPRVKLLVTSHEPLQLQEEWILDITP
jgi:DNA-binding SARP family transcriptional activator